MRMFGTFVAIILISLIGLEAICAALYAMDHGSHRSPWVGGPPLQTTKFKDDYDFDTAAIWTNKDVRRAEGLYARETIKLPAKGDDYWVFLIGGSTAANVRKKLGDRLSDHIERGLDAIDGRKVRVFNFGVPSYIAFNELSLLTGKLLAFKPDMVIAYDGVNDAHYGALTRDDLWYQNYTDVAASYRRRFVTDINLQQSVAERLISLLQGLSYTVFYASQVSGGAAINQIRDRDTMTPDEYSDWYLSTREKSCSASIDDAAPYPGLSDRATPRIEAARAYVHNIEAMRAATESIGARFVHVQQPIALGKKHLYPCESFSIRWHEKAHKDFLSGITRQYQMFAEALAASKPSGAIYLDLTHATDDIDEYLFDDWHHAFPSGHLTAIVGKLVADGIKAGLKRN